MSNTSHARLKQLFDWRPDPQERMRIWSDGSFTLHKNGEVVWANGVNRKEFKSSKAPD